MSLLKKLVNEKVTKQIRIFLVAGDPEAALRVADEIRSKGFHCDFVAPGYKQKRQYTLAYERAEEAAKDKRMNVYVVAVLPDRIELKDLLDNERVSFSSAKQVIDWILENAVLTIPA